MGKLFTKIKYRPFIAILVAVIGVVGVCIVNPLTYAALPAPGGIDTGLVTWQKANDGVSTNTAWQDSSGNGNTANGAATLQSSAINFNQAYLFNGGQWFGYSNSLGIQGANEFTAFGVGKVTGGSSFDGPNNGNSQSGLTMLMSPTIVGLGSSGSVSGGSCGISSPVVSPAGTPMLGTWFRTDTVGGSGVSVNGANLTMGTCDHNVTAAARLLGRRNQVSVNSGFIVGNIAEKIQYNRTLSAAEQQRVQSYLATKYGITMAAGESYIASDNTTIFWDATTNAAFHNNVTGIGRDDNSALNQKQSKSVNPGALVTVGNGNTIAADNPANGTSFADNMDFLAFGDNNGSTTWTMTAAPTNRAKLNRTFKVQNTGNVGSVKLQVPRFTSTAVTKLPPETVQVYVLTDADGDFSSGATETLMTLNGTNFEADTVLADGSFFTFATNILPPTHITSATDSGTSDTDGITNFIRPDFTGACAVGQTVTLSIDGTPVTPTAICDGTGNYIITPDDPISEGDHVATVAAPTSGPYTFTIDTINPAPGTPAMTPETDSGASNSDDITNDNTPVFTGSCIDGQTVTLEVDGVITASTAVCVGNSYTITASAPIPDGDHVITTVQGLDIAGNTSVSSGALAITVDTVAPAAPLILSPTTGTITSNTMPTFEGTGEDDATVTVTDENNTVICIAVVSGGTWSCTPTIIIAGGARTFKATQTDVAGNISPPSVTVNVTINAPTTPIAPTIPPTTSANSLAGTGMNVFTFVVFGLAAVVSAVVIIVIQRKRFTS